ncbi:carbohydrate ABC transporter permease [Vallitalea pronyensis]|uniref:Carbohydrate ABC transporter permease n=1 Tax=Vallitalea pronyensis TaxID=1348613 RepID=A0A8J8MQ12_9FIRM|nr:carbohydrate ABC transporter permease [Vallitalea pronyensis]
MLLLTIKNGVNKKKKIHSDGVFTVVNYIILFMIFIIVAYPLVYVISASFSSSDAIIQGRVKLLPVDFSLAGYEAVFSNKSVWMGYANSFFYMIVGTTLNVITTIMIAYPLTRKDLIGRKLVIGMLLFTMLFNAGLIPNYLTIDYLGLMDKRLVMILPKLLNPFNVIITMTYFKQTIPKELLEASIIDGCDNFKFITKIVVPLSKSIIAVISLYYAVAHWNAYFDAMLYLKSVALRPLQLVLRDILIQNQMSAEMMSTMDPDSLQVQENLAVLLKYSLIIIASIPLMILYPFVQKHFVKGVMIGSVKG